MDSLVLVDQQVIAFMNSVQTLGCRRENLSKVMVSESKESMLSTCLDDDDHHHSLLKN